MAPKSQNSGQSIMKSHKVNRNVLVAVLFFGSSFFPVLVWLVVYATSGDRSLGLTTLAIIALTLLAELALFFATFVVTLANWRSLRWPWRLLGLLSAPIFELLAIGFFSNKGFAEYRP
jgi:multisubunit Na+/H+ antiporter MnhF subunit